MRRVAKLRPVAPGLLLLGLSTAAPAQDAGCTPTVAQSTTLPAQGYRLPEGEFVPEGEVQPSADGRFWRCRNSDGSRSLLAPPRQ